MKKDAEDTRIAQLDGKRSRIQLTMEICRFRLPPVESALVVGKHAGIGPRAMEKALAEMLPDTFVLLPVDHEVIEAIIVRKAHLRRVPQDRLVQCILRNSEGLMDDTDMLHFDLDVRVRTTEELEV